MHPSLRDSCATFRGAPGAAVQGADRRAENARLVALRGSHGIEWRKPAEVKVQPAASALSIDQKVTLFRRLFLGRADVYPVRWASESGNRPVAHIRSM